MLVQISIQAIIWQLKTCVCRSGQDMSSEVLHKNQMKKKKNKLPYLDIVNLV